LLLRSKYHEAVLRLNDLLKIPTLVLLENSNLDSNLDLNLNSNLNLNEKFVPQETGKYKILIQDGFEEKNIHRVLTSVQQDRVDNYFKKFVNNNNSSGGGGNEHVSSGSLICGKILGSKMRLGLFLIIFFSK
jgi:hypothetical protein